MASLDITDNCIGRSVMKSVANLAYAQSRFGYLRIRVLFPWESCGAYIGLMGSKLRMRAQRCKHIVLHREPDPKTAGPQSAEVGSFA